MLLWHLGETTAITRYAFRDERMDLRLLLLGAVLPDLIDTPAGLAFYSTFGGTRLIAHSLIFAGLLMTWVVLATRRGRPRKRWMPLAIGVLVHLFLDGMWASVETLWWPAFGAEFTMADAATAGEYVGDVLSNLWVWIGEALGAVYLVVVGNRAELRTTKARQLFRATGRINVPIDSRE